MFRPLFPSSAYLRIIENPRESAYRTIASDWFSVEYCWCSVDIRTYSAARVTLLASPDNLAGGLSNLPSTNTAVSAIRNRIGLETSALSLFICVPVAQGQKDVLFRLRTERSTCNDIKYNDLRRGKGVLCTRAFGDDDPSFC